MEACSTGEGRATRHAFVVVCLEGTNTRTRPTTRMAPTSPNAHDKKDRAPRRGSAEISSARPRQMAPEERKKQIVDVTLGLIGEHGLQGVTTARIAAAAGVADTPLSRP